jgi:hypothetical protein
MKHILLILLLTTIVNAQTIAVHPIEPVNIQSDLANAITARVQETATHYRETVDRGTAFQALLEEHGLRMSGATKAGEDDNLTLTTANIVISGQTGYSGNARWFLSLSMTDVNTSVVFCSKYVTVTTYQDLLAITNTATKALIECTDIEADDRVIISNEPPIIMKTDTVVRTIYEREEHKIDHSPRFVPCAMCGGLGKIRCVGNEVCPSGYKDCPFCSVTSMYQGPETHGQPMTGHWSQ